MIVEDWLVWSTTSALFLGYQSLFWYAGSRRTSILQYRSNYCLTQGLYFALGQVNKTPFNNTYSLIGFFLQLTICVIRVSGFEQGWGEYQIYKYEYKYKYLQYV